MGLFSRKFDRMQTEEQKYAARQARPLPQHNTPAASTRDSRAERWEANHPIAGSARVQRLRSKVEKVGKIEKRGGKFVVDGWTFKEGTPEQVRPGSAQSRIGSLTFADLCDIYEYETGRKVRRR
ncbi:hypothetical protein [Streptomyces sp. FIT100]|uniref:hypothetical protein n=1 Tax=Streptomyces sp. FIT100 TaxID=2837956 RepID=UPI0021CAB132|nr:hypothetical protein [Streptomyces sp. FIT100]UUN27668.1 hypothetical protein KK483_15610 [Streptomyces sp. FIT100]